MSNTNFTTPTTINHLSERDLSRIYVEQTLIATCPGCRVRIASDHRITADPIWLRLFLEDLAALGWVIDDNRTYCSQECIEPGRAKLEAASARVAEYAKAMEAVA